jgi:hypothetical protein
MDFIGIGPPRVGISNWKILSNLTVYTTIVPVLLVLRKEVDSYMKNFIVSDMQIGL